jgi:spore coat protein H
MRFVRHAELLTLAVALALAGCRGSVLTDAPPTPAATAPAGPPTPSSVDAASGGPPPPPRSDAGPVDAARLPDASADARGADSGPGETGAAVVFDPTILHRIELRVAENHLAQLEMDQVNRVPCEVVYDGTTLPMSAIRKKGGPGSLRPLADKPAFSIKFNELIKGQKLRGLSKLLLNNATQDESFLSEHMIYEIARRAGAAAPLTAHGLVTFNGRPLGLYVVREAFNDDFVERNWGKANQGGNFYEGGEFVRSPDSPELKDEREEMRSRADLREASRIIQTAPDATWVAAVGAKLDLPSFYVGWAVEALADHWDGYFFGPHNYYLYHHPGTDRLVFLVAGMDSIFSRIRDPRLDPKVLLAMKFMQLPEARAQFRNTLVQLVRTFDLPAMQARIDRAARTIHSFTPTDARTMADYRSFDQALAEVKADMAAIKAWTVPVF